MSKSRIVTNVTAGDDSDDSPDRLLAEKIEQALGSDLNKHRSNDADLQIECTNGAVRLYGYVGTTLGKVHIGDVVRRQPSVVELENNLTVDDELMHHVALALGSDTRMLGEQMVVRTHAGFVYLSGTASHVAIRQLAAEITAALPQVRGIINRIQAPGMIADAEEERILQPRIGLEVFATDGAFGRLQKIVINPHNRRVSGLLILAQPLTSSETQRQLLIPISAIRDALGSGVFLNISSSEATHRANIEPRSHISPPNNWQVPYPYRLTDVLLQS